MHFFFFYRKLQHSKILSSETQKDMPSWNWHLLADPFSLVEIRNELMIMLFFLYWRCSRTGSQRNEEICLLATSVSPSDVAVSLQWLCPTYKSPVADKNFVSALRRAPASELLSDAQFGLEFSIFWQVYLKQDLCVCLSVCFSQKVEWLFFGIFFTAWMKLDGV